LHLGQAPNTKNEQIIENCIIEKSLGEAIKVQSGRVDIINCTIRDCMNKTNGYALRAEKAARVRFVGNTIEKMCHLFDVTPEVGLYTKNNITKNIGDSMTGGYAGIRIFKGRLRQDMTWNSEFTYILEEDFTIDKGARLTVLPGNVIKVKSGAIYVNGAFDCKGTEKNPIYITSLKDDTIAGDTNLDGQNSKPLPGDFDEIEFEGSVKDCNFTNTIVRWGGGKTRRMGAVKFGAFTGVDDRVKWVNCTIENSNSAGFYLINSSPYIEKCIVTGSKTEDRGHGVYTTGVCQPKITDCNFENSTFAIFNNMPNTQLVIEDSWFGDKTGPQDEAENKEGMGLKIHGNVMYRPFKEEPVVTCGAGGDNGKLPGHTPPEIDFPMPDTSADALVVEPITIMADKGSKFEIVAKGGIKPYTFKIIDETLVKLVTPSENSASFTLVGNQPSIIQVTDSSDQQVNVWVVSKTINVPSPLFVVNPIAVPVKVGQTATFQTTDGFDYTATLEPGKSASIVNKAPGQITVMAFMRGTEKLTIKSVSGEITVCKIFSIGEDGKDSTDPYEFHAIPGDSSARLVWRHPNIQKTAYAGAVITMDGKKLTEVDPEISSYQVTGLANGKTYAFSIKNISGGAEIKATCKPYPLNIKLQLTIGKSEALINGQKVQIDKSPSVTPIVIKGSTYVPFRFLAESLGADVGWIQASKEANFWTPKVFIQMYIGKTDGFMFGSPIKVNPAPEMVGGKVMIPLRAASELLGAKVDYNPKTKQITINYAKPWFGWW
jgi:plastocyanin